MSESMPSTPAVGKPAPPSADERGATTTSPLLAYGHFVFRHRNAMVPVAAASIVLLTRPHPLGGDPRRDVVLDLIGIAVAACGQILRVLVIGLAYIQRGGKNRRIAADRLVTDGIFAHCRHPLYVGNFLLFAGLMIVWNSPWAYVFGLGGVGFSLFAMATAEEDFLRRKFGAEYERYCARVNRFVPDLRGFRHTLGRFEFDWKRVVRKEYGTTFSWTTMAIVLIALEHYLWDGTAGLRAEADGVVVAWLGLAGLWGMARWMKKTRRLVSPD